MSAKTSDYDLLDAWSAGDRSKGDELFHRYFDSIYRFFSRKVQGDVEDLIQKTFLACVEGRDKFRKEASFRTYLFSIARNQLYRYWRNRKHDNALDFTASSLHDLGPTPSAQAARHQEQRLLLEALLRIPLDLQIAIELHYWEGMSGPELAEVLDIPEGTVRSRLRRAKEALEAQLSELATNQDQLRSTLDNFDRWARSLRDHLQS